MAYRISQLQKDDLESAIGEIHCAGLIARSNSQFRFIVPSGTKGSDYEAEATTPNGTKIFCEIKTKKESTELSEKTISTTLDHARRQLPKDNPGVIFLKIPETWVRPDARAFVDAAVTKVLRQSNRLVAVVLVWEEWHAAGNSRVFFRRHNPYFNTKSPFLTDDIRAFLNASGTINNPEWIRFASLYQTRLSIIARQFQNWRST